MLTENEDYIVEPNSADGTTIIKLKSNYLNTLDPNNPEHTLKLTYSNLSYTGEPNTYNETTEPTVTFTVTKTSPSSPGSSSSSSRHIVLNTSAK